MSASSVSGVGNGSADGLSKGSEHFMLGVEKLIGTRIVLSGTIRLAASTGTLTFPQTLPGVAGDYIVMCSGAHLCYASSLTTVNVVINGTSGDDISYILVRVSGATV